MSPILLLFVVGVCADPIIIRSGINKDQARHHEDNVFDVANVKGIANYEGEEGFNRDNERKLIKAQDSGNYNQENAEKKQQSNANDFADNKFHQQAGGEASDYGKKASNKKGHHKTGFNKSYFKDESGNTSTFYDDADDQDHQNVQNNKKNQYGDAAQQSQRGSDFDDRRYLQDQNKKGYYDNAGNYERDLANQRDYHQKKYYDNKENQGRRNAANEYGEADRYQQNYARQPHYAQEPYYEPYYNPKKTITIYEDPRYEDGYEKYPRYDHGGHGDYVQLDVRRPTRGYDYNRNYNNYRPPYEGYYY